MTRIKPKGVRPVTINSPRASLVRIPLTVAILACAMVSSIDAMVLVPVDLDQLAREARAIVRGRVAAIESRFSEDRRTVETIVTLDADQYLKGEFGSAVQFTIPGGRVGRYRRLVVGAPAFSVAEPVIVFLGAHGPSIPYVLGLTQGVYRLVRRGEGWMVSPPPIPPTAAPGGRIVRGDPGRKPVALAEFERQVRTLVAAR